MVYTYCLRISIIVLFVNLKYSTAKTISYNKCDLKQPKRGILELQLEQKPAKLLNATTAYSLKDCSKDCCNKENCNAYIWRNSEQCFLFQCKILEDCKVVPYQGTITGFVSKRDEFIEKKENSTENSTNNVFTVKKISHNQNNLKSSKEKDALSNLVENSDDTEKSLIMKSDKKVGAELQDQSKRNLQGLNGTAKMNNSKSSTSAKISLARAKAGSAKNITVSVIPVFKSSWSTQKITHTTTTSLIAALAFGLIFVIAVAVLIGTPWWQSFFGGRDGYNRVTFLMNGK